MKIIRLSTLVLMIFLTLSRVWAQDASGSVGKQRDGDRKTVMDKLIQVYEHPQQLPQRGGESGGGGNSVVCRNPQTGDLEFQLLDYYQAKLDWNLPQYNLGPKDLPYMEKVEIALSRLQKRHRSVAKLLRGWANDFEKESNFLGNISIISSEDSKHHFVERNCQVWQTVFQDKSSGKFKERKRYLVDDDIWQLLDNDARAGLILHEVIYRLAIELHQTDSEESRYLNAYIAADLLETFNNFHKYIDFLKRSISFLKTVNFRDNEYDVDTLYFYGDSEEFPASGYATARDGFTLLGQKVESKGKFFEVKFGKNGNIKECDCGPITAKVPASPETLNFDYHIEIDSALNKIISGYVSNLKFMVQDLDGQWHQATHGNLRLNSQGLAYIWEDLNENKQIVELAVGDPQDRNKVTFDKSLAPILYYPLGRIKSGYVPLNKSFYIQHGPAKYDFIYGLVEFDEKGKVIKWQHVLNR